MKTDLEYGVVAFATILAGCVSIDTAVAKVAVIQTASPALAAGSTFAWESVAPAPSDAHNDIIDARLRQAIEAALAARGYRRAPVSEADLIVSYRLTMQEQQEFSLSSKNVCGPRFGCAAGGYDLHQSNYVQGKLILDLKEGRDGRLVWRAMSDKKVKESDASQERLDKALLRMTRSLPPTL